MTKTQELAVQALADRGFRVARTRSDGHTWLIVRFATPAVTLNAVSFLRRLGVDARSTVIGGQWALQVR